MSVHACVSMWCVSECVCMHACMHACMRVCVVCAGQVMLSIGLRRGDICEERVCM